MESATEVVKKNPEVQGVHILKSYLLALKIPFVVGAKPNELLVQTKDGSAAVDVVVGQTDDINKVKIDPLVISSFKLNEALSALHTVTEAAGYGKPQPLDRGAAPTGRVNYLDNFEDVYLRHSIFRRSPNKTAEDLEPYMPTIKRCARKAMYRWKNVFQAMGFSEGDLLTTGMVYTISYLHHYCYAPDQIDNIKLLTDYLKQRFGEMAKITFKKALNATCLPQAVQHATVSNGEEEISFIDAYAESEEASPDEEYEEETFALMYPDGSAHTLKVENDGFLGLNMVVDGRQLRHDEARQLVEQMRTGAVKKERVVTDAPPPEESEEVVQSRRKAAREELIAKLSAMPQEQREVLLGYAAFSRDYAPDARREARKLCDELVCPKCNNRVPSGAHCIKCEVAAVPRLGVDYLALKAKLQAEHHPMAEAMSAAIPESEVRARAKKPQVAEGTVSIADATKDKPVEIRTVKPVMSEKEMEAVIEKMAGDLMKTLPDFIECPKCHKTLPKTDFGIRVAKDKATGIPARASRQSYCKPCRSPTKGGKAK